MGKEKLLISSCLLGEFVKYNGHHNLLDSLILQKLNEKYTLYPFCPETEGGLSTPRIPCEIISIEPIKVINQEGKDTTLEFIKGANLALKLCIKEEIKKALLKVNSPSCGNYTIYDGTFTGKKIKGSGVTTLTLNKNGIEVFNEKQLDKVIY